MEGHCMLSDADADTVYRLDWEIYRPAKVRPGPGPGPELQDGVTSSSHLGRSPAQLLTADC